jgi:hypothetical protein
MCGEIDVISNKDEDMRNAYKMFVGKCEKKKEEDGEDNSKTQLK